MKLEHNSKKLEHLKSLFTIAVESSSIWENEHPEANQVERGSARARYFSFIADMFWDIAVSIEFPGIAYDCQGGDDVDMQAYIDYIDAHVPALAPCEIDCEAPPSTSHEVSRPMWVLKTPDGYKLYSNEKEVIAIANDQLYTWTEKDVQSNLDELGDDQLCTEWMSIAARYLESRELDKDRVSSYYSYGVYDVTGLKDILGRDGWVELLTLLQLGCKILEVHQSGY